MHVGPKADAPPNSSSQLCPRLWPNRQCKIHNKIEFDQNTFMNTNENTKYTIKTEKRDPLILAARFAFGTGAKWAVCSAKYTN